MNNDFEELKKQIGELDSRGHDAMKEIFIYEREVSQTLLLVISAIFAFLVIQPEKNKYIFGSIISLSLVLFLSIGILIHRRNILKTYHQNLLKAAREGESVLQGKSFNLQLPDNFGDIRKQASRVDLALMVSYFFFFLGIILFIIGFSV